MSRFYNTSNELERLSWLRLIRTPRVGAKTFWELMQIFGSASEAIKEAPRLARNGGGSLQVPTVKEVMAEIKQCKEFGAEILLAGDEGYPQSLRCLADMPPLLTIKGRQELLMRKQVAIVGARNASIHGARLASQFARDLGREGLVITSGLARGIDIAAHRAAIEYGTIAVIAGGIDHIYPKEHADWYARISAEGVVISELKIGSLPLNQHFPQRNRLIAALSMVTVIVEAAQRSGTLITARHALDCGRDVLAVPGSPLDPRAQGTNALIRQGATLVTCSNDILEAIYHAGYRQLEEHNHEHSGRYGKLGKPSSQELDKCRNALLQHLSYVPCHFAELVEYAGIPMPILVLLLIELELGGKIYRSHDNQISLLPMTAANSLG